MDTLNALVHVLSQLHETLDIGAHVGRMAADAARTVGDLWATFVLRTVDMSKVPPHGDFTRDPIILTFEPHVQGIALAALVPAVVWASYRVMFGHGMFTQYTARIILPRILLAAAASTFCLQIVQAAVDLNNALCREVLAMGGASIDLPHLVMGWSHDVFLPIGLGPAVSLALVGGFALLGVAYVVRYALLVLLAILSPLVAVLMILPETHHYAREWSSLFITTLFMQPLQLLILVVALGMEEHETGLLRHGFALAGLWICFKVPGALHSATSIGTHAHSMVRHEAGRVAALVRKAATRGVA